ncbi:PepSY domain-containing protein [Tropicimonas sp. IMCC6043]|uniref:PepSY domain-containing protein n=1 Tax=Tropicimonas sp. IMCC6043 TaxID=2510645 RepID=UPI00101CC0B1|nr:PepSY domain-containing protein [Tropicimonas sp. IMCC6043]RYH09042.1 N-acetylglucosamine transferase [Tropicimonas sp. IMCC6043]
MIRPLHRWAGLVLALLVSVTALSGAVLSLYPAAEAVSTPATPVTDVGSFVAQVQNVVPGLEQIRRAPSGRITAYAYDDGTASQWVIDPANGTILAPLVRSPVESWFVDMHRAFFAGDAGRIAVALVSLFMVILSVSGFLLAARRMGGWRRLFGPLKGPLPQRLHLEIARAAGIGLLLSALTGLWLFAGYTGLVPHGGALPALPPVSGVGGVSPAMLTALKEIQLADLRALTLPRIGDLRDVFTIETTAGIGYVDQGSGALLAWAGKTRLDRVSDTIQMLHKGEGAAWLGMVLGLCALSVPVLSLTGWLLQSGRSLLPRGRKVRVTAEEADTILLVGSEGGTTWGFADSLRKALTGTGSATHVAAMSDFAPERYLRATRILIFAATSGDGDAPASARGFLNRLDALPRPPAAPVAILGFGDSAFPRFCAFTEQVRSAVRAAGRREMMPLGRVDRQSHEDFARWGATLAEALGVALPLDGEAAETRGVLLPLLSRRDYGEAVQAPTAILRFALPRCSFWARLTGRGFARFQAGDLIGVIPEGDTVPRYYSLASGSTDGFIEICVRRHPGDLCSGQLTALEPGETIRAFLRRNAGFHPVEDKAPLILIGAGTGIGPLAGFARANTARRPMHLYFGARDRSSDLLYGEDLHRWQKEGKLSSVVTAFSRSVDRSYVQDALRRDADALRRRIADGARIMVCGGRDMAAGVAAALEDILAPSNLGPIALKAQGRYVEDVY